MTPIQTSKKVIEKEVYSKLQDRRIRQKPKPKKKLGDYIGTADIKRVFSKGDSTDWNYKLYTLNQILDDTIPSYRIDNLPERYIEILLLPAKLTLEQNNKIMKEVNLVQ